MKIGRFRLYINRKFYAFLMCKNTLKNTKIYHKFVAGELNFWLFKNLKNVLELSISTEQIIIST